MRLKVAFRPGHDRFARIEETERDFKQKTKHKQRRVQAPVSRFATEALLWETRLEGWRQDRVRLGQRLRRPNAAHKAGGGCPLLLLAQL